MITKVFKDYDTFRRRADKTTNGVSPEFAALHPDWEKYNEYNIGCWECINCRKCINCTSCVDCINCWKCIDCTNCIVCEFCVNCECCISCENCEGCDNCISCNECHNCGRAIGQHSRAYYQGPHSIELNKSCLLSESLSYRIK